MDQYQLPLYIADLFQRDFQYFTGEQVTPASRTKVLRGFGNQIAVKRKYYPSSGLVTDFNIEVDNWTLGRGHFESSVVRSEDFGMGTTLAFQCFDYVNAIEFMESPGTI
jgi:hypothetical protein